MARTTTLTEEDLKQLRVLEQQNGNQPPMEMEETIGRMASLTHENDHDVVTLADANASSDQNNAEAPPSSIVAPTVDLEELGILLGDQKETKPPIEMMTATTMNEQLKELGILAQDCQEEITTMLASADDLVSNAQDEESKKLLPDFALNAPRPDGNDSVSLPRVNEEERKRKVSLGVRRVRETPAGAVTETAFINGHLDATHEGSDEQLYSQLDSIIQMFLDAGYDRYYQHAMSIQGPDTLDLAIAFHHAGLVCSKQKDSSYCANNNQLDEARRCAKTAVALLEQTAPESALLAKTCGHLGIVCGVQNQWDEARRCCEKALSIHQQISDESSLEP